jgi:hypothetical protein
MFNLSKYDIDTEILNIQNKNIEGTLDLKNFNKLKILICSKNSIDNIINLPNTLIELYCNLNKLTFLNNIPNKIKLINISSNKIEI